MRYCGIVAGGGYQHLCALEEVREPEPPIRLRAAFFEPGSVEEVAEAVRRLRAAEHQLTDYRRALHQRLDAATAELIERYRRDPASALVAFQVPHAGAGKPGGAV